MMIKTKWKEENKLLVYVNVFADKLEDKQQPNNDPDSTKRD